MKICIINNIYPPYHRGGAEQVVVKTVEGLIARGHTVTLITGAPKDEVLRQSQNLTIYRLAPRNIYFYPEGHRYPAIVRLFWQAINIHNRRIHAQVKKILIQEQPDIVHTHNLMGLSFSLPGVIRALQLPHVHTVHDVQLVEPSGIILKSKERDWRYNGFLTQWYTRLVRRRMGSPNVVISPSNFLLNFYRERGFFANSTAHVLRNPLTFAIPEQGHVQKPSKPLSFVYVGQIESHKGVRFLLRAFQELSDLPARLHIIGSGSDLKELQKEAGSDNRITLYGRVSRKELARLFPDMDVTVVPSLCYENSPTVIFESFSFGIPVLASNIEGVAELIDEQVNGLTFDSSDIESLKSQLRWCVEHRDTLNNMSNPARESIIGLSPKEYIDQLLKLYQRS